MKSAIVTNERLVSSHPLVAYRVRQAIYALVSAALCIVHLLLPVERGFPTIRILGYPFTLTILVSLASFALLLGESDGRILRVLSKRYVLLQLFLVWIYLVSALISPNIQAGLFVVLSYFTTFVLDFFILSYLFMRGFRKPFILTLVAIAFLAALVGILEGLFRFYFPAYSGWFLDYNYAQMLYAMSRSDFRALGTLGNPIVYSVALALAFPFAMEIENRAVKYLVASALLLASFLAVSTTGLLMWLILGIGVWYTSKHKIRFAFLAGAVSGAILLVAVLSGWEGERIGYIPVQRLVFSDQGNSQARLAVIRGVLDVFQYGLDFSSLLFGNGLKSAIPTVQSLGMGSLDTADNAYVTILFEAGVLGLAAFLAIAFYLLVRFRKAIKTSLYWYAVLSWFIAGMTFTTTYYSSFNFVWVASIAALTQDRRG